MTDLSVLYDARFRQAGLERRNAVWRVLCRSFFSKLIAKDAAVLDIACGYGEFINNIEAREKHAVDLNPDAAGRLAPDVRFHRTPATDLSPVKTGAVDVVFSSNFLEHLRSKDECDQVLREALRVLKPGGTIILLGPNIRYAYKEYWDFYDHYLPLSDRSLGEGLMMAGFTLEKVIPRFLPFTMNSGAPTADFLIEGYLALPIAWKVLGKQFLLVARKPEAAA
ncbi:class I SAM-dependent methyltransferase [Phenylobacterium sp.]|jgi:SAM-dependent methyltransferase|uniref:class I SAM-dependent methyltransferase n=1 Tax=Phenylobacterium sp. TaxID=1871053 RepID=UPI002F92BE5B